MKKDLLVTLADMNYLNQAKQLFYGARAKGGWTGDMMLLAYEIPEADLDWFVSRGILIYHCASLPAETSSEGKWPSAVQAKFELLKTYFKKWDNMVFLDVDIIIRSDITALAGVRGFAAVQTHDSLSKECMDKANIILRGQDMDLLRELNKRFDMKRPAFSSGVFAFSTDLIEETSFDSIVALQRSYGSLSAGGEELAFNLFFTNWKPLSVAYNVFPDVLLAKTHMAADEIPGIILHFILHKPWMPGHPFYPEWKKLYEEALASDTNIIDSITPTMSSEQQLKQSSKRSLDLNIGEIEAKIKEADKKAVFKGLYYHARLGIDKGIGICGLALRRILPRMYFYLKK